MRSSQTNQHINTTTATALLLVLFLTSLFSYFLVNDLKLGIPPDEIAHLSKIKHAKNSAGLITQLNDKLCTHGAKQSENPNYLSHPPLYYHLSGLLTDKSDCTIVYDYKTFRLASIVLSTLALVIILTGISSFNTSNSALIIFALFITSIPIFPYISASTNNDNLAFFSFSLLLISWILIYKQRHFKIAAITLSISIALCLLSKATAGLQAVILSIFLTLLAPKQVRSSIFSLDRDKIVPAIILSLPLAYYLFVKLTYGTFLPSTVSLLDHYWDKAPATMSLPQYISHYFNAILRSFTGITSHENIYKTSIVQSYGILLVTAISVTQIFRLPKENDLRLLWKIYISGIITTVIFAVIHFIFIYAKYRAYGYPGGVQFRYYLTLIPLVGIGYLLWHSQTSRIFQIAAAIIVIPSLFWGNLFYYFDHRNTHRTTPRPQPAAATKYHAEISYMTNKLTIRGQRHICTDEKPTKLITYYKKKIYDIHTLGAAQDNFTLDFDIPFSCHQYMTQLKNIKVIQFCDSSDSHTVSLINQTNCQ